MWEQADWNTRTHQNDGGKRQTTVASFKTRSFSCPCTVTLVYWRENNRHEQCDNTTRVTQNARNIKPGHWSFLGPEDEDLWYGSLTNKPDGQWDANSGDYDTRIRQERTLCILVLISIVRRRAGSVAEENRFDSLQCKKRVLRRCS